jgi:flavin-dependent dehydrogenase
MQEFDVVIIGAGPSGGQCARNLVNDGWKVLLVEQHESFFVNNFSSGVCPLNVIADYNISPQGVKSYWDKIAIHTTNVCRNWHSSQSLGVIFEFAELREFLSEEVKAKGGEVWMGCRYLKHCQQGNRSLVYLKHRDRNERAIVSTKVLVDATGFARAVIYSDRKDRPTFLKASGIEYLLQVDSQTYQKYAKSITFFLGHYWSPRGYAWIFPMQEDWLKVGTMIYVEPHKILQEFKPIKEYAKNVIETFIQPKQFDILDIHGSRAEYSKKLSDRYYQDNLIALGDAVSTINFLGFEGIRHAFKGAEMACQYISSYLRQEIFSFEAYKNQMQKVFRKDWIRCEQIARKVYLNYSDRKIDWGVAYLKYLSLEDLLDILFDYKFEKYAQATLNFLILKINFFIEKLFVQDKK